jgi:sulfotransferase famil protein
MKTSYIVDSIRSKYPHLAVPDIVQRLRYGSFVSLQHRLLYVETPKAACTALKGLLRTLAGAPPLGPSRAAVRESRRDMLIHVRANVPFPSLVDLDDETQRHVLTAPDFLRFVVVRNPYSRLISAWRNKVMLCEPGFEYVHEKIMGGMPPTDGKTLVTFEQFIAFIEQECDPRTCDPHWRRQVDLLFTSVISYTHVGKVERIAETLDLLRRHLKLEEPISLGHSNTTNTGRAEITDELAARVFAIYEADFTEFGYEADSWRAQSGRGEGRPISEDRFNDEVIERNLVIAQLYQQYQSMRSRYQRTYRFSLSRIRDKLTGRVRPL